MAEKPGNPKPTMGTQPKADDIEQSVGPKSVDPTTAFALEQHFPDAAGLFVPYSLKSYDEAVVTLDANALLLPYSMGNDDLSAIADVYLSRRERFCRRHERPEGQFSPAARCAEACADRPGMQ